MFPQIIFIFKLCSIFIVEIIKYYLFDTNIIKNIAYKLAKVNILCVKIFQAISLNIDKSINDELIAYTDQVPYSIETDIDFDNIMDLVSQEGLYIDINKPIASGMISIVYKALVQNTTQEPQYKIIKVKRRNIDRKLNESIENILFLINVISFFPSFLSFFDFKIENIDLIKEQLDFNKEIQNMKEMKENYKNNDYIKIPEVYPQKYPDMILMEYIDGIPISKVDELDYEIYAKQINSFNLINMLIKGTIHGDLHCGNILFIKEKRENKEPIYKLGIIDFGLVYKLDEQFKNNITDIFIDIYTKPPIEVANKILISGLLEPIDIINNLPHQHKQNIIQIISTIIDDVFNINKKGDQVKIFEFINKLNDYFNKNNLTKYNIQISKNFLKFQLSIAMNQGINIILCKEKHIEMMNTVIREIFHLDLIE